MIREHEPALVLLDVDEAPSEAGQMKANALCRRLNVALLFFVGQRGPDGRVVDPGKGPASRGRLCLAYSAGRANFRFTRTSTIRRMAGQAMRPHSILRNMIARNSCRHDRLESFRVQGNA